MTIRFTDLHKQLLFICFFTLQKSYFYGMADGFNKSRLNKSIQFPKKRNAEITSIHTSPITQVVRFLLNWQRRARVVLGTASSVVPEGRIRPCCWSLSQMTEFSSAMMFLTTLEKIHFLAMWHTDTCSLTICLSLGLNLSKLSTQTHLSIFGYYIYSEKFTPFIGTKKYMQNLINL